MNCLTDYIGLKSCSATTPESGIWINDLPGMSNELLNSIATSDQVTFKEVWNSVQRVVYEQIKSQLHQHLFDMGQVEMDQTLFQTNRINIFNRQVIMPTDAIAKLKGVWASAYGSKYLAMNLKSLYVYNSGSVAVADVPFKVYNTFDWSILHEETVDLEPGINEIPINQVFTLQFQGFNLFFALDTTDVPTIRNPYTQDWYSWGPSDCACANQGPNHYWDYQGFQLYPAVMDLDPELPQTMNFDWAQSGVYVDLELMCSIESFICQNRKHLKMGIAYALASQILLNKMAGSNQNFYATYNPEQTNATLATFNEMRDKEFKTWARIAKMNAGDICFSCDDAQVIRSVGIRS